MNSKNKRTAQKLFILTFTLIFTLALQGTSLAQESDPRISHPHEHHSKNRSSMLKDIADFLKLNPQSLHDRLQIESLAEIAAQQGIERTALKDKMVELMKSRAASKPSPLGARMDFSAAADKLIDKKGGWNRGSKGHHRRLIKIEELAALLKVTPEKLKESLHSGKSLASIAKENGVPVQTVIDQQIQAVTEHLDRRLAEGKLSKEQYVERKAKVKDFVTNFVYGKHMKKKSHSMHYSTS